MKSLGIVVLTMLHSGLLLSVGLGCSGAQPNWADSGAPAPAVSAAAPGPSSPHWLHLPSADSDDVQRTLTDGTRYRIADGLRIAEWPDQSLSTANQVIPSGNVKTLSLPARLGGGFLFYAPMNNQTPIWRAETWTGELSPLATIAERVDRVDAGFDRIYLTVSHTRQVLAIDPETGELVSLGALPRSPGYRSLAFASEWFAAAAGDIRGVLVTFDAGASWHPTNIQATDATVRVRSSNIEVRARGHRIILTPDGQMESAGEYSSNRRFSDYARAQLGPIAPKATPRRLAAEPLGSHWLRDLVLYGAPLSASAGVVATQGAVGRIRLQDGRPLEVRSNAYAGVEPCVATQLGQQLGFVCSERDRGTQLYALRASLELQLLLSFSTPRFVTSNGNGRLVVRGRCDDAPPTESSGIRTQSYCAISFVDGQVVANEVRVRGDVGSERVVALQDGRVAIVIPPRLGVDGRINLVSRDETTTAGIKTLRSKDGEEPEASAAEVVRHGSWTDGLIQLDAGTLGAWIATAGKLRGVKLKLDGTLDVASEDASSSIDTTIFSGRYALDVARRRETQDFGFNWRTFETPPGLGSITLKDERATTQDRPNVGCSSLGCAYGQWARIGRLPTLTEEAADAEAASPTPPRLTEVDLPTRVSALKTSYSRWRWSCYPTGKTNQSPAQLSLGLNRDSSNKPLRGPAVGFVSPSLGLTGATADVQGTAYRDFLGINGPPTPREGLGFDVGGDGAHQFRSYAWGQAGSGWMRTSAWQVRVANRFDLNSIWATAATQTPWPDLDSAAQTFGADRASRYGTNWHPHFDPDEEAGVVRVNARSRTELHLIEKGKAVMSIAGASVTALTSVVKTVGGFYLGEQEGERFRVYSAKGGRLERVADFPLPSVFKARLARSTDGQQLSVWIRSRTGDWYLYPLRLENGEVELDEPLVFDRTLLNQKAAPCDAGAEGWLVSHWLPLTRESASGSSSGLRFRGTPNGLRTSNAIAKVILNHQSVCVSALAAQTQADRGTLRALGRQLPKSGQTVPLVLSDRIHNVRAGFRCHP